MANYVVERSTGWALTHPLSISEYEQLKKQMKPDFLDMVPWYSGTSTNLFKTVFDLMVSVTLFVGRFDMRMMQAAMNKVPDDAKNGDLLYDHLCNKDELWFDFMADTGDGGNSTYAVARLLAQPSLQVKPGSSKLTLPRGDLLLIGGDLAYPNPSAFTYERRLFCPFEYALQPPSSYKAEHIAINKPELPYGVSELKQYKGPQSFLFLETMVPKDWKLDPDWDAEPKQPLQLSYLRRFPSKWRVANSPDPVNSVRVVDHFVIQQSPTSPRT